MKKLLFLLLLTATVGVAQTVTLVPTGASWKYRDNGSNQGTTWRAAAFNDASWSTGNAELGYGDGDEATVVSYGSNASQKYVTTYFRKSFTVANPASYTALTLNLLRDDGAVVYLNGTEVARSNMPSSTISYNTRASLSITGTGETTYYTFTPSVSLLLTGNNVIAVEIHQYNRTNADISFNLSLIATSPVTCGTPGSLTSSSITSSTATVGWAAVSGATSYNLRYRPVGSGTWTTIATGSISAALTGLAATTAYEFSVQAICSGGSSAFSSNANFTTLAAPVCGIPGTLSSSSVTTSGATLNWVAVTNAMSYNVQYRPTGSSTWTTVNSTTTSKAVSGLTASTTYEFSVQTVCSFGSSAFSSNANFTTLAAPVCGIPGTLSSSSVTTSGATLNWVAVTNAISYNVQYRPTGSSTWTTVNSTTTSKAVSGLTASTTYEFSVQTVCSFGSSAFSSNANFTTLAAPVCGIPGTLSSSSVTTSGATLNWVAVTNAISYNVQYRITGSSTWTTINSTTTSKVITGLTASTTYEYSVQTVCSFGSSAFSANSNFTTLTAPVCGIPGSLTSTSITTTGATINWAAVAGAISYNLQFRPSGSSTWTVVNSTTNTKSIGGLLSGTLYEYSVQTVCASGPGAFTNNSTFSTIISGNDSLITTFSSWKYLDNGTDQGTAWRASAFNDASWLSGNAELGYGDGDEATTLSYGTNSSVKYITTYFRKSFNVSNPQSYGALNLSVVRDDGIVVYLNGTEVYRNNMPTGTIAYNTLSPVAVAVPDESAWYSTTLNVSSLVAGTNVIAVEIHQQAVTSSDISFKARLVASGTAPLPVVTRGAYLQMVTPGSITVRWRTDVACNSTVNFGTTISYGSSVSDAALTTEHIVNITGLTAGTRYYYSVGTSSNILQGDVKNSFVTSPISGSHDPVRIWATGDFGDGSTSQIAVRDAFVAYNGTTTTNLWIWLGDNAYSSGTDTEYQSYVFGKYPDQLKSIPLYPAPGNHDYGNAGYQTTATLGTNYAYFSNFTVPQAAQSGGVASNTPKYYSYNYANIHFISLDSYGSYNSTTSAMYTWLNSDLAANTQRWTVVYFHHPPYTKGTHNSDTDVELINMRANIIPLLENYHVDLVLCGHSHINERSYLIKGHYGIATTFTAAMKINNSGTTISKTAPYDGTVYATCGTSGQIPGTTQAGYPMPCMYFSNNTNNCSLVMDVAGDNLTCKYLASTGSIVDQFTITKTGAREIAPIKPETVTVSYDLSNNSIVVDYYLEHESKVSMNFVTMTGQIAKRQDDQTQTLPPGFHRIDLETPDLASGIYFLQVTINGRQYNSKVVVP